MKKRVRVFLMMFCALTAAAALPAGAAEGDLNIYFRNAAKPEWAISQAADINEAGVIVGVFIDNGGNVRGFAKDGGTFTTIHPPGWLSSVARRIAPNGTLIGEGKDGADILTAFLYSGGTFTPLLPPGWTESSAGAVNSRGQAVGTESYGPGGPGFLYDGGAFTILQVPGATKTVPADIGETGVVVGSSTTGGVDTAFLYDGGIFTNPAPPGWTETAATRINSRGDILGSGEVGGQRGCWLKSGGTLTTITIAGALTTVCTDLTETGAVVGAALIATGGVVSFIHQGGRSYLYADDPTNYFLPFAMNGSGRMAGFRNIDVRALEGLVIPTVSISANGEEGDIAVGGAPLSLKGSLRVWSFLGRTGDVWLLAQTPAGIMRFDAATRSWQPGFAPAATMKLLDIKSLKLPGAGTAPGVYTYYFGVDLKGNGVLDFPYWVFDRVTVFVR